LGNVPLFVPYYYFFSPLIARYRQPIITTALTTNDPDLCVTVAYTAAGVRDGFGAGVLEPAGAEVSVEPAGTGIGVV
jgi:hypothetical protein